MGTVPESSVVKKSVRSIESEPAQLATIEHPGAAVQPRGEEVASSLSDDREDREPTTEQIMAWRRDDALCPDDRSTPDQYPVLTNISAGFMYSKMVRPLDPAPPEYVTVPMEPWLLLDQRANLGVAVARWNLLWEAGQLRRRFFDRDDLPEPLAALSDLGDVNLTLVPRTPSRYFEYAPLLHLLPKRTLEANGLPVLRAGQWPFLADHAGIDDFLPGDFEARLSRAWAHTVWPHLESGSRMKAFSSDDPIKLLAQNLDFWIPAVTATIQERLRDFPEGDNHDHSEELGGPVTLNDGSVLTGAVTGRPRMGGPVWFGEEDAGYAVEETVYHADSTGRLRGILDAVRSNRVEDDFSDHWSFAREDFERKLHGKRRRVKVTFVEVPDTVPVQGPESEVIGNLVTNDFLSMLDVPNRRIVVLLNSGVSSKTEIASILGYANHSAVSKRLAQIRNEAQRYFDQL